jgi:hypothetical protein
MQGFPPTDTSLQTAHPHDTTNMQDNTESRDTKLTDFEKMILEFGGSLE